MYKAFKLHDFSERDLDFCTAISADDYVAKLNQEKLSRMEQFFMDEKNYSETLYVDTLDADKLSKVFFPEAPECKVFISHSHSDVEYASYIAYLLHLKGINAFIDAHIWNNMDELLNKIDQEHCRLKGKKHTYDYSKRNISTSNVHMILFSALINMIDSCECFLFLDTQNSIEDTARQSVTYSPWIMGELLVSSIIQKTNPRPQTLHEARASTESFKEDSALRFLYGARTKHLQPLSWSRFMMWYEHAPDDNPEKALDKLYTLHRR